MSGLIATPPLGSAARGGWARGLRLGHAQMHAAQPGPRAWFVARPSSSGAKVQRLFERQGGHLSIATQEPNWSRSPSLLSSERLTAVEVCVGPGSAGVEHKQVGRKSVNFKEFKSKYYSPHGYLNAKRKFKRLPEA